MSKIERKAGYYWVKTKRTKVWMIARWWPNLNGGKGFWDTMRTIENDIRDGFSEVDENQIVRIVPVIKRIRRNKPIIRTRRIRPND